MLKTPAPFPNVGAWALLEQGGETLAVRIVYRDGEIAAVAAAGQFAASAAKRVPVSTLLAADALSPDEQAEYAALDARLAGRARPRKADLDRFEALRLRWIRAERLQELLAAVPARHFPAAATKRNAA